MTQRHADARAPQQFYRADYYGQQRQADRDLLAQDIALFYRENDALRAKLAQCENDRDAFCRQVRQAQRDCDAARLELSQLKKDYGLLRERLYDSNRQWAGKLRETEDLLQQLQSTYSGYQNSLRFSSEVLVQTQLKLQETQAQLDQARAYALLHQIQQEGEKREEQGKDRKEQSDQLEKEDTEERKDKNEKEGHQQKQQETSEQCKKAEEEKKKKRRRKSEVADLAKGTPRVSGTRTRKSTKFFGDEGEQDNDVFLDDFWTGEADGDADGEESDGEESDGDYCEAKKRQKRRKKEENNGDEKETVPAVSGPAGFDNYMQWLYKSTENFKTDSNVH